jgi:hypothetical protein
MQLHKTLAMHFKQLTQVNFLAFLVALLYFTTNIEKKKSGVISTNRNKPQAQTNKHGGNSTLVVFCMIYRYYHDYNSHVPQASIAHSCQCKTNNTQSNHAHVWNFACSLPAKKK